MPERRKHKLQESGLVQWTVFSELLAMDEDEEGFVRSLFVTFVQQFEDTFEEIEENIKNLDLDKLSSLGHYLKGSAAALGLEKISAQCERIQNYGHKVNFDKFQVKDSKLTENDDGYWIELIRDALERARKLFKESRTALSEYFEYEL